MKQLWKEPDMRTRNVIQGLLISALLSFVMPTLAEDTDLFVNPNAASGAVPNVLFIVDNTANWSTPFTNEISALAGVFNNLPTNSNGSAKFNVGILFSDETGNPNNNTKGGYVRAALRPMTSTNRALYGNLISALDVLKDKGNAGVAGLAMAEAYLYYSGGTPYAGNNKVKSDYTGNSTSGWSNSYSTAATRTAMQAVYNLSGNALSSISATTYNSPVTSSCQKNFIIYLSNGAPQDNNTASSQASTLLSQAGGDTTTIPVSPSGSQDNMSDEWARFMKASSYGIVTYTIDVDPSSSGQGPGWTALLKSMASVGGGKYFSVTSGSGGAAIANAINTALSEIQAVNSVFASVSLPVSVNTQGTYLNQVFIGMFRPDATDFQRWAGNLKQYKLGYPSGSTTLSLLDANSNAATNSSTGFITQCARSFWTPTAVDSYWTFKPQGSCLPPSGQASDYYMNSNYPDGDIVEKGGQAYTVRSLSPSSRSSIYTCSSTFATCAATSALTQLSSFSSSNYALLGLSSSSGVATLINWALGQDVQDENTSDGVSPTGSTTLSSTVIRPSVHGDVVHSRPVALNFGSSTSPSVVVFYGANDGMLRAINGNREAAAGGANIGSVTPGNELWSFVAPESYMLFNTLYNNTTQVYTPTVTSGSPKLYGMDGPITSYQSGSSTWLFAGMRRGGRVLYAFDVSSPASPTLKWKIGCPHNLPYLNASGTALATNSSGEAITTTSAADNGCSSTWTGLGQTWSSAKPLLASGYGSGSSPLLIMGGGYDTCEDADPNTCTSSTKGKYIYVLDAATGALQATLSTDRAVVGDVFVINDSNGKASWAYAVDLGGNIYRISGASANSPISTTVPGNWTITKIASLGCSTASSCSANRKFLYGPDIVDNGDGTYSLLLGSGDREKPLNSYTSAYSVQNDFFVINDNPTSSTWLSSEQSNCSSSLICLASLGQLSVGTSGVTGTPTTKGWYLPLAAHEQVVTSAIVVFGQLTFSTNIPVPAGATNTCTSTLGTAQVYNMNYKTGASMNGTTAPYQMISGGGLPPSPVAGMVTLDNGKQVPFIIGSNPNSPLNANNPPPPSSTTQPTRRVYWYIKQ